MAYTHPGIRARRKGERRDRDYLHRLFHWEADGGLVHTEHGVVGTLKVVGSATFANPYNGRLEAYDRIEVYLESGVVVPCYRKRGGNYVICQDHDFKAYRP